MLSVENLSAFLGSPLSEGYENAIESFMLEGMSDYSQEELCVLNNRLVSDAVELWHESDERMALKCMAFADVVSSELKSRFVFGRI